MLKSRIGKKITLSKFNVFKGPTEEEYIYDHTAKLPAGVTGTFLLKKGERIVSDVHRPDNHHVNKVVIRSRKNFSGTLVPRVLWDVESGAIPVQNVTEMDGCEFLIEISTKTVEEDKTEGRKFAKLMGDLLDLDQKGLPLTLEESIRANRIVIRPFVTIKKPLPIEANVRVQFKYKIKPKKDPKASVVESRSRTNNTQ